MKAAGWHALRDEGRGWVHARLTTPIAALWACHPTAVRRQRHGGYAEGVVRRTKAALEERVEGTVSVARLASALGLSKEHHRATLKLFCSTDPLLYDQCLTVDLTLPKS